MSGFDPYTDNGGSSLAIAGKDFCLIAADTRQSEGYSINTRYAPKAYKLTDKAVLATSGFHADGLAMAKQIKGQLNFYLQNHGKVMPTPSMAQMISIMLYSRRFFPYYAFNILGGIDETGKGVVYSYDPVGSFELEAYRAGGSAAALIQPFLDNQIGGKNINPAILRPELTRERAIQIAKDAFTSATERDIYTGDLLEIWIVTKTGVELMQYELKKD